MFFKEFRKEKPTYIRGFLSEIGGEYRIRTGRLFTASEAL